MLKPSFKTLEGQKSLGVMILGALYLVYDLFMGGKSSMPPMEEVLEVASSVKELSDFYAVEAQNYISEFADVGKTGIVVAFMYKIYAKFTDSRTELKKKEEEKKEALHEKE